MNIRQAMGYLLLSMLVGCANIGDKPDLKCQDLSEMISKAVPQEVGSEDLGKRLLNPQPGKLDIAKVFDPNMVSEVLGDQVEEKVKPCISDTSGHHDIKDYCNEKGTVLRIKAERGRLTYLNPSRSFSFEKSEDNKLKKEEAIEISRKTLDKLGVPMEELAKQPEARVMIAAGRDREQRQQGIKRRAELHVRYPRQVSDIPVFDSAAKLAIDNKGDVARMHLVWPAFKLAEGLSLKEQYSRDEVIRLVKLTLKPEAGCYNLSRLHAFVAYAESSEMSYGEGNDEGEKGMSGISYVPSLVVYAVPPEPKEDSGEISMAGMQFTLPLFSGKSAGDSGEQ